jgi:hypothetical protein
VNKSYKTVWNETTGTYVAVSEVAKARGKKSRSTRASLAVLLAAGVGGLASMQANAGALDGGIANGGSTSEAIGAGATTGGGWDVALGSNATTVYSATNAPGAIAIGGGAKAWGANSISNGANVAIGYQSVAGQSDNSTSQATALGTWAQATDWATTAIGDAAIA